MDPEKRLVEIERRLATLERWVISHTAAPVPYPTRGTYDPSPSPAYTCPTCGIEVPSGVAHSCV